MKYEAPYGVSDPNASYINGNPSTGTMGSIPPAASIENPQREIVNFESDSGLTPTDADLHQLSKAVQNGMVNYCQDAGTPNFIAITPSPALAGYALGQHFRIKMANANTGPVQINISGVGWAPVVHGDKTNLGAGELFVGQMIDVAFDNTNWQMMTGGSGGLIMMTAPRTLYLDANIGSDTAYDGTQATINGTQGPFKTLQHAINVMLTYNLGGWNFTIKFADGDYVTTSILTLPQPNGSGNVLLSGNPANPFAVRLINAGTGTTLQITGGNYYFDGLYIQATAPVGADNGSCIWVVGGGASAWIAAVSFGQCPGAQLQVGGTCSVAGPIRIYGGAANHLFATNNGVVQFFGPPLPDLTIMNAVSYSQAFIEASNGASFVAPYNSITGAGFVTGAKYIAVGNGVINTEGRGVSYYPGTVAGATSSGGQYL